MKKITFLIGILFIICCIGCEGDSGSDSYRWVDLGFFNGIKDINNSGQIIGTHEVQIEGQSYTRSLLYNPSGTIIDLGTFGGHAYASDINNEGEVVGTSYFLDGGWHAFLYQDEEHGMIDLGTLG